MNALDVLSRVDERGAAFICENLAKESTARFRVPVEHRRLRQFGPEFDAGLTTLRSFVTQPSLIQLHDVLADTGGLGLFAATRGEALFGPDGKGEISQEQIGSIWICPPQYWANERAELSEWLDGTDGLGSSTHGLDDIIIFAGINYSPDRWYVVTRGPDAGRIFYWGHDGDAEPDTPWADDLIAWGDRIWQNVPELFGGTIRWEPHCSEDDCPPNAELFPLEFVPGKTVQ